MGAIPSEPKISPKDVDTTNTDVKYWRKILGFGGSSTQRGLREDLVTYRGDTNRLQLIEQEEFRKQNGSKK